MAARITCLNVTLPRFGITTTFVDPRSPDAFAAAITDDTQLILAEITGNPGLEVLNVPVVADVAHSHGIPLMVDSTFTTPYLINPVEHGADIIMHSVTKFLGGHGIAIGGALIDGGRLDWTTTDRFPTLTQTLRRLSRPIFCRRIWSNRLRRSSPAPRGFETSAHV